jgi:hypothetical protein
MLTLEGLIAIISLCLTVFSLGYTTGSNNAKKITAPACNLSGYSFNQLTCGLTVYR